MVRLVSLLVTAFAIATGLSWLAERPGSLVLNWQGYEVETSVFRAVVILALIVGCCIFGWNLLRQVWLSPAIIGNLFNRRRNKRGLEALSTGLIALGAGDKHLALRYAVQARRTLPNEPLTHLLRAQAARLAGDTATSRRIFEAMLSSPDTEQLGLRGLYLEAEAEGETEAARQFAERALKVNPKLGWAVESTFDLQCRLKDWDGALDTLQTARKHGHLDKATADRRRAVILTGQAQEAEDHDPERALNLALEAHGLAADLVPAAAIAGRMLASKGNTPRATRIIQTTWRRSPHPDLATAYAYARIGDSPRDRLDRIKQLVSLAPMSIESPIALATAAIEAKDWDEARSSLEPLAEGRLTQRICTLMARVEGEQHGDKGRVREWLARAVNAPRDPAWTADGVVSQTWQPVSPVTGALDAFQWKVPVELAEKHDADLIAAKLEELVALGAGRERDITADARIIEAKPVEIVEDRPSAGAGSGSPARSAQSGGPIGERKDGGPADAEAPAVRDKSSSEAEAEPAGAGRPAATERQVAAKAGAGEAVASVAALGPSSPAGLAEAAGARGTEGRTASPAPAASRPDTAAASARKPNSPEANAKVYVAPRAPDDPGPDEDERRSPLAQMIRK